MTWEQRVMEGDPKFDASQDIPNVPYHRFAEMIGLKGIYVDDPEKLGIGLGRSVGGAASGRPGSQDRSRRPAIAAAHHPRPGEEILAERGERRLARGSAGGRRRAPVAERGPAGSGRIRATNFFANFIDKIRNIRYVFLLSESRSGSPVEGAKDEDLRLFETLATTPPSETGLGSDFPTFLTRNPLKRLDFRKNKRQ